MGEQRCLVCGMKINSSNYMFNQYSFLEKNRAENIISCPFCGVDKLYLSETQDLYKAEVLDEHSIRILDSAMKLEIFNGEFYQEASKLANCEEIKKKFKDLSSIEFFHARVHMRLGCFSQLSKLHKPDYSKHDTDEKLLEEACKREKHAVHFYERYIGKISCEAIKKVLIALSEVEKQHIAILE